jgi:hypothetical protein
MVAYRNSKVYVHSAITAALLADLSDLRCRSVRFGCCRIRRAGPSWLIPGHTMGIWPPSPSPDWGSPGAGPTRYRLTVTTKKQRGAGTDKPALVQLHGSRGSTGTGRGLSVKCY